ncbi:MAG: glycoside hydrolase family 78 protein, partial [Planctomycetes bacterium]|nr:glycoside hydrolase family 78 protein [Planctomycetota bacterium]
DGEVYDARRELPGWAAAGYDDSSWQTADIVAAPAGRLVAPMMPPMRVTETVKPVKLSEPRPGVWVFDLGQNIVGWCRLRVEGPRGTAVRLRHAETLDDEGMLYTENLRSAKCRDVYMLRGDGPEVYEPRFTYHGFRFVELTGYPGRPDLSTIQGCVVHTDLPSAGQFACSSPLLNQLHQNIRWGLRGNYLSIPTDCPQRDERQGWQGDRAAESRGETYFFENVTLYNKWLVDIQLSQNEEGNLSDVCPPYWPFYSGNVTWPSAYTIVPGTMYDQYGDRRNLRDHFSTMQRWMEYLSQYIQDGVIARDTYGDWCVPPETPELIHSQDPARKTGKAVLATTYYYHNLHLLSRYAIILGRPQEEARALLDRATEMNRAFHAKFYDAQTGIYDNGTQTSSVLPLAFGMVPESDQRRVFEQLVDNIEQKTDGHIGTGLIGGQWLMRTLSDNGRADLAYRLASNRTYPSWGYMIDHGATTVWELWNGNTADPAMNSGNHVMLVGDLGIWFYEYLAGIKSCCLQPAFKHIVMRPYPVGDLTDVRAEYRSIRGRVDSHWHIADDAFVWEVTVPTGSKATLFLPAPA